MSHEIVEQALKLSKADQTIVIASEKSSVNLRWANNTLTTNGAMADRSVCVISIFGKRFGMKAASLADDSSLDDIVRASEQAARDSTNDAEDYNDLISGSSIGDFSAPAEYTSTKVFDKFASDLGAAFERIRGTDQRLFGFAEHTTSTTWLGTSTGLRRRAVQPVGSVEWTAKDSSPNGSVWHGEVTRDFSDIDVESSVALLQKRLGWCKRSVDLPAGRYEAILPPSAMADLLIDYYWSSAGRDAADGRSVFSKAGGGTRIGEAIAADNIHLYSDPSDAQLSLEPFFAETSSSSFASIFDNGTDLSKTSWIENGRLSNLIETRSSAANSGASFTPYIHNLIMDGGGTASLDEMIASTRRGLLVTCLWYIRVVDPQTLLVTGLTRDGVYLIEDGEVTGVVNNFRFNESPVDLLGRITEVGRTEQCAPREWLEYFKLTRMPAVRIPDFNMSSVSQAS